MKLITQKANSSGFTLVELVMTLVIIGILSATALPKLFSFSGFQQRALFDDTLSAVRYAQKLAVGTGCNVQVAISSNQFKLSRPSASDRSLCTSTTATDFSLTVVRPSSNGTSYTGSISGISISSSPATFYFMAKGNASTAATITVGTKQIYVVQDTGYVYAP